MGSVNAYLDRHCLGTMFYLGELAHSEPNMLVRRPELLAYKLGGVVHGVCGFTREGRCLPFFDDERVVSAMVSDITTRHVRWLSGLKRVLDALVPPLQGRGLYPVQDECEILYRLTPTRFRPFEAGHARKATLKDLEVVAELRTSFEAEYFATPRQLIPSRWAKRIARRYVEDGTWLIEEAGQVVAMAAVEVEIPQLSMAAAVYTRRSSRRRGYAKAVVSALAADAFSSKPLVLLTVREANTAAVAAYRALGFEPIDVYRFVTLGSP